MPPVKQETFSSKLAIMAAVPGSFNQDTVLYAKAAIAFPVKQGQLYKVAARKDNTAPYLSTFQSGWKYGAGTPDFGPEGDNNRYSTTSVCKAAPVGMLVGAFVPATATPSLNALDLNNNTHNDILETVFSSSFPVSKNWQGTPSMDGYLVLLMNDGIAKGAGTETGYSDNDGAVIIKVSPAN
jgi:hypothetical protein